MRIYDSELDTFTFAADYRSVLIDMLNIFPEDNVKLSLVSYSTTAQVLASLTSTFEDLLRAVDNRQNNAEFAQQRIDLGIVAATNELVNFGRPDVDDKYIIVFLDGTSVDDALTRASVIDAGNANITLIAISMRGTLDESSVIAGRSFRTFFVNAPSELNSNTDIIGNVTDIICQECKGYADVVYLLDGSDSTRRIAPDFSTTFYAPGIIGFVKNTTLTVNMGPIRKGIVVYSKTAQIIQNMTGDANSVIAAVEATDPEYENTNAHLAFSAGKEVFDFADPQRAADVDKLIVYLVDGFVTDKQALADVSRDIRDEGILVAGVGFSPSAVFSDLLIATGNPNNIFRVATDMDLEELVTPLVEFLCRNPTSLTQ